MSKERITPLARGELSKAIYDRVREQNPFCAASMRLEAPGLYRTTAGTTNADVATARDRATHELGTRAEDANVFTGARLRLAMAGLTIEQRAAVTIVAGADPDRQLDAIGVLAPTWGTP
jgi:hypothetical protein